MKGYNLPERMRQSSNWPESQSSYHLSLDSAEPVRSRITDPVTIGDQCIKPSDPAPADLQSVLLHYHVYRNYISFLLSDDAPLWLSV